MIDTFVRRAAPQDATALAELEVEARRGIEGQRGADRWLASVPVVGDRWAQRCADPGWLVLVGGIDDVVLGMLAAELPGDDGVAVIEQVFVSEGARELGLGDAMVEVVLEELRACGAKAVDATALPGDRQTKNLYERNGLTARLITVSRRLEG